MTPASTRSLDSHRRAAGERVRASSVVHGRDLRVEHADAGDLAKGLRVGLLLGPANGSIHMEVAISALEPGGYVQQHVHPFEESFFMLSGEALLSLAGQCYGVRERDFGFAPIGMAHAWSNPYDRPTSWLRVRAPQPRPIADSAGTYVVRGLPLPEAGIDPDELNPTVRFVGRFSEHDMPEPGPLSMPGYHGHNVRGVSIRMMVDEILGAQHHAMFMVQFTPSTAAMPGAKEHFHPFEEMFYFLAGNASASLTGVEHDVGPGDLLFLGVGASHGIRNAGTAPVRWIEVQAPKPPPSHAFCFEDDWRRLPTAY